MEIFNKNNNQKKEDDNKSIFIPYHHLAIFDRTYKPTKNGEGVVCAVLCFTVLEAFINDVIGVYDRFSKTQVKLYKNDHPANNYLNEQEQSMLKTLKLKEAERESFLDKLEVLGEWNKSEKCYQDLKELKRIRNNLVHLRSEEVEICNETGELAGHPKFLNNFLQKKIISKPKKLTSWIELLETREFCLWCQETTYQVLKKATEMLPDSNIKNHFKNEASLGYSSEVMRKRYATTDQIT